MLSRFKNKETLDKYMNELAWRNTITVQIPLKPSYKYAPILVGGQTGAGENVREMITLPVVTGNNIVENPVIPSSSIKGVFRKITYSISRSISQDADTLRKLLENTYLEEYFKDIDELRKFAGIIQSHKEGDDGKIGEHSDCGIKGLLGNIENYVEKFIREERKEEMGQILCELLCPICSIYGGFHYRSAILFNPIIIDKYDRHMRTHVAIDRKTLTKFGKALFIDHLVIIGEDASVKLELMVRDLEPGSPAARLLASTLSFIQKHGLLVGGGKSTGYGLLEADDEDTIWHYRGYKDLKNNLEPEENKGLSRLIEFLKS